MNSPKNGNPPTEVKSRRLIRKALAWTTLLLGIAIFVIHFFQFDQLASVTLIPPWLWLVPAIAFTLISQSAISRSLLVAILVIIISFAAFFVEEARSLIRFGDQPTGQPEAANNIRVASLNCNFGSSKACLEPQAFNPEIVLFQESPGPDAVNDLAKVYFGEQGNALHGGDVSIIVNGTIEPVHVDRSSHFLHATVTLSNDESFDVVSLRLSAPVFRMDFVSAGFWNDHTQTRRKHREQLQEIIDHLRQSAKTDRWIIGGDFNLVGNDGALTAFEELEDSFYEAGTGWCNTGTSEYPLFRVDQIWMSKKLSCTMMKAYRTRHSDHRMVVADIRLKPGNR